MKKLIAFILILLVVFSSGCATDVSPARKQENTGDLVVYNGIKNPDRPQAQEFLEYLEADKGITIIPTPWNGSVPIQELDGLLRIDLDSYRTLYKSRHASLLPLNDILAANTYTSDIPESIMKAVTDDEGVVWGFLLSHNIDFYARVYNDEIMMQLDMDIPRTPEKLKEYLIAARETSNLDAMQVVQEFCAEAFYDIFAYFGCPVIDGRYTIGWDENKQAFVDCAFSDEMIQSLDFINELKDAGLISGTTGTYYVTESAINDGKTITAVLERGLVSASRKISSALDESVIYLEYGSKEVQYFEEVEYHSIYVVPINTSDPEARVHDFINTFYGDETLNKVAEFGIDGKHFTHTGPDFITAINYKTFYNPRLAGWWLDNHYIWLPYHSNEDYIEFYTDNVWTEVKSNFYNGVYKLIPIDKSISYDERHVNKLDIHNAFNNMLFKFIMEDMEVQEFLDGYKELTNSLGAEVYIAELNSRQ